MILELIYKIKFKGLFFKKGNGIKIISFEYIKLLNKYKKCKVSAGAVIEFVTRIIQKKELDLNKNDSLINHSTFSIFHNIIIYCIYFLVILLFIL